MYRLRYVSFVFLVVLSSGSIQLENGRMFFAGSFKPHELKTTQTLAFHFKDSIPDTNLSLYFSADSTPIAFSRNIHTAVCSDGLCRLVDLSLYWDVMGKVLGYCLLAGKELTKKDHDPFLMEDYTRLQKILCDSVSLLKYYSIADIHPVVPKLPRVDGITGATTPDMAAWIVPEAAYTTLTLWHIAYGETRDSIVAYTQRKLLSNQLAIKLLKEDDPYKQMKVLEWMNGRSLEDHQFIASALDVLHGRIANSVRQALLFLKSQQFKEEDLQKEMSQLLLCEDFKIRTVALEYFNECSQINPLVARGIITHLSSEDFTHLKVNLNLLERKYQASDEDQLLISKLLASENRDVSNQVYYYLQNLTNCCSAVKKQMKRYRKINQL